MILLLIKPDVMGRKPRPKAPGPCSAELSAGPRLPCCWQRLWSWNQAWPGLGDRLTRSTGRVTREEKMQAGPPTNISWTLDPGSSPAGGKPRASSRWHSQLTCRRLRRGPGSALAPPSPGSLTNGPQFLPGSTLSWATHQWAPVLPWLHPLRDHSPMGKQAGRDACAVMCKKAPVPPTTPDTKEKRKGQGSRGQERVEINSHYLHQKD